MQISQQNFIVKANTLQFISFDSDELFTVKLTPSVITLNRLFQSIIEKESEFLDQIKAFQRMLETSQILSTEPQPDQFSTPSVKKHSILEICSPIALVHLPQPQTSIII